MKMDIRLERLGMVVLLMMVSFFQGWFHSWVGGLMLIASLVWGFYFAIKKTNTGKVRRME